MITLPERKAGCLLGLLIAATSLPAQSSGNEFFEKKIRPVLAANCYGCHSSKLKSPMGGLVLDTKTGMRTGGASGPITAAANPSGSLLVRALKYNDLQLKMPPTGKLPDAVIADFEQWIAAGAPDPRADTPGTPTPATGRVIDFEKGKQWWAFQPVKELPTPAVKSQSWPKKKIDSFILAKLEKSGLTPSPEADPRVQIQRAYLDLVGYKPTYSEVEVYVNNPSPQRYENLVDDLLASPHYGERWGRYWLDVARYGEDGENPTGTGYQYAWRYRDWVIDALNKDVPYDRFVKLQLAADLMPATPRDDLRALGFLGTSPAEHKEMKLGKTMIENLLLDEWDERLDVVARGVLGLTVACARCHDHKFDPISSKDYYALAGVFASTAVATRPLHAIDPADEARFVWIRQHLQSLDFIVRTLSEGEKNKEVPLTAQSIRKIDECKAEMETLRVELTAIKERNPELSDEADRVLLPRPKNNGDTAEKRRFAGNPNAPFINAVYDAAIWVDGSHPDVSTLEFTPGKSRDLPIFFRGNAATPGEIVPRRFLTVLSKTPNDAFGQGSGRLELGGRIFGDAAQLTARVIVNRVWGWHFDKHLVDTPSDFGSRGDLPTHPELLDDLAARFIANGWSMKWLHREIMLSATYRQSSHPRAEAEKIDPANQLL